MMSSEKPTKLRTAPPVEDARPSQPISNQKARAVMTSQKTSSPSARTTTAWAQQHNIGLAGSAFSKGTQRPGAHSSKKAGHSKG